jgi:hypothetical protein
MTRLQNTARTETTQTHTAFRPHSAAPGDKEILEAEKRVRDQEAHVLRLIVQGAPTQSAEDLLCQLTATAKAMREQLRRSGCASGAGRADQAKQETGTARAQPSPD